MSMIGVDVATEEQKDPDYVPPVINEEEAATAITQTAPADATKALVSAVKKKRKLHRQLTGTEVPWFPHDNAVELLQELVHEAGRPPWVYFGTPAGGAGMQGCLEMGSSVMALCFDGHHRQHLGPFLVRALRREWRPWLQQLGGKMREAVRSDGLQKNEFDPTGLQSAARQPASRQRCGAGRRAGRGTRPAYLDPYQPASQSCCAVVSLA